jgi:hypothetical protein
MFRKYGERVREELRERRTNEEYEQL